MTAGRRLPVLGAMLGMEILKGSNWPVIRSRQTKNERVGSTILKTPARIALLCIRLVRARVLAIAHIRRWRKRPLGGDIQNLGSGSLKVGRRGLERCDVVYINLAHRVDRREHFQQQMRQIAVDRYVRLDGVLATPGSLGCAISHAQALSSHYPREDRMLVVCEDDATFKMPRESIDAIVEEFFHNSNLSVL